MTSNLDRPLGVLFLCTANSARSQIAEALLNHHGGDQFIAGSAGSTPADAVHPYALRLLKEYGIDWEGEPKGLESIIDGEWDFVITVCDRAKEKCPIFPGHPIYAHWGIDDPAATEGSEEEKYRAFFVALEYLRRRVELLLSIPMEKLERQAIEARLREIPGIADSRDYSYNPPTRKA